jgi:hypothetical protein
VCPTPVSEGHLFSAMHYGRIGVCNIARSSSLTHSRLALLRFAGIAFFLQTECLWQPCVEQVYRRHFSNSMCSLRVSVSHFGNSSNISNFSSIIIIIIIVIIIVTCFDTSVQCCGFFWHRLATCPGIRDK